MNKILVFPAGTGEAMKYTQETLRLRGVPLADHPTPEVTHLLLDVPTVNVPISLLERLPEHITVVGGNLDIPGYRVMDLLRMESYLAENAAITAECALQVAAEAHRSIFAGSNVLVIGWGRIGKCLGFLLKALRCSVTVAARKEADRAMLRALGFSAMDMGASGGRYDLIYNTVPAPLPDIWNAPLKIDLASVNGLPGEDVIHARGLPGKYAAESSGRLIADIFMKEVNP